MAESLFTLWIALLAIIYIPLLRAVYNVYFHPLSKVPGPRAWAASQIPFNLAFSQGNLVKNTANLHARYGPVVRTAPNEVSFARFDAWADVMQSRKNQRYFPKNPVWWAPAAGVASSIFTVIDQNKHARMRRAFSSGFSTRALRLQEEYVQKYVNLLVERLSDLARGSEKSEVDMTPWFNYTTFDVFSELSFGEPFGCLQDSRYHPWIAVIFSSVKFSCFAILTRYYPLMEWFLHKCIPSSLKKMERDHHQQIVYRVERRLGWEVQRPDIMSALIGKDGELLMPVEEINESFFILAIAASETTATALSATLSYLVSEPDCLKRLEAEVRDRFTSLEDITLDTVRDLSFLDGVLHESMRLCPPIPWVIPRVVPAEGDTVCGTWLPGGTSVSLHAYAVSRDPKLFHKSASFLPERWLHSSSSDPDSPFFHDQRNVVQPFGVGPRTCLGVHLAWAELRLVFAKLIWTFDFAAVPGQETKWENLRNYIIVERKPVNVRVSLREGAG